MAKERTMELQRWLIVRANGDMRVAKRLPKLGWNEIAFKLNLKVASSWAATASGIINLEIPEGTVAVQSEGMEEQATPH